MEALLEKHERLKMKYTKMSEMCKSYKIGYKKSQKKVSELSLQKEKFTQKFTQKIEENEEEIKKQNGIIHKYKQIGSDFATKKKVLFLQQTVNEQEEKMFKLKEKIKVQNNQIMGFNELTKNTKEENMDLKNTLNNIQIQISKHITKSISPSSEESIEVVVKEENIENVEDIIEESASEIESEEDESGYDSISDSDYDIDIGL